MIAYIRDRVQISKATLTAVSEVIRTEEYNKGHILLREGLVAHHLYFIKKGAARTFYYHDGKDVTSWVYGDGAILTAWGSFYGRSPSFENIELLENSVVEYISHSDLQKLYAQYPRMQTFGRLLVEEQITFIDNFFKGFMFMTAKEKYELLQSTFPDVIQRINLGHIASFLGISQETLSRIRRK